MGHALLQTSGRLNPSRYKSIPELHVYSEFNRGHGWQWPYNAVHTEPCKQICWKMRKLRAISERTRRVTSTQIIDCRTIYVLSGEVRWVRIHRISTRYASSAHTLLMHTVFLPQCCRGGSTMKAVIEFYKSFTNRHALPPEAIQRSGPRDISVTWFDAPVRHIYP